MTAKFTSSLPGLAMALLCLCLSTPAHAGTCSASISQSSVQSCVTSSANGDTIISGRTDCGIAHADLHMEFGGLNWLVVRRALGECQSIHADAHGCNSNFGRWNLQHECQHHVSNATSGDTVFNFLESDTVGIISLTGNLTQLGVVSHQGGSALNSGTQYKYATGSTTATWTSGSTYCWSMGGWAWITG